MRIVDPHRPAELERHEPHLLAVPRHRRQLPGDHRLELLVARWRTLEHCDRADVHVADRVLDVEERRVERAHPVHGTPPHRKNPASVAIVRDDLTRSPLDASPLGLRQTPFRASELSRWATRPERPKVAGPADIWRTSFLMLRRRGGSSSSADWATRREGEGMKPMHAPALSAVRARSRSRARSAVDDATSGARPPRRAASSTKYLEPLPLPGAGIVVATPSGPNRTRSRQTEITRQLHPDLPPTPLWAYDDGSGLGGQAGSFGMAVVAQTGTPLTVDYTHALPETYPELAPGRHAADAARQRGAADDPPPRRLRRGRQRRQSRGDPERVRRRRDADASSTPTRRRRCRHRCLWFHDHGLGATRLNVFAGLAAAYILRDEFDTGTEPNPIGIPGGAYEIPLVVQDRQFNPDGTFLYPTSDIPGATWIGEYFGDTMLVNGKVWPFLDVEPRMYRFRILNGCNARILSLDIGGPSLWQIGAEGGMFDVPVPVKQLVLAPAERADVLVDFTKFAGSTLVMKNHRPRRPVSNPAPSLESGHADPGRHDRLSARARHRSRRPCPGARPT